MPNTTVTPVLDYYLANRDVDTGDTCKVWPYGKTSSGYGKVWIDGRDHLVHVLACIAAHGPRPEGMEAAHGPCHNRACWNPRHLSWKTSAENKADRLRDGTHNGGEANPFAVLTADDVTEIRQLWAAGRSQVSLGEQFQVHPRTIGRITARTTWRHVE